MNMLIIVLWRLKTSCGEPRVPSRTLLVGLNDPYLLINLLRTSNIFIKLKFNKSCSCEQASILPRYFGSCPLRSKRLRRINFNSKEEYFDIIIYIFNKDFLIEF